MGSDHAIHHTATRMTDVHAVELIKSQTFQQICSCTFDFIDRSVLTVSPLLLKRLTQSWCFCSSFQNFHYLGTWSILSLLKWSSTWNRNWCVYGLHLKNFKLDKCYSKLTNAQRILNYLLRCKSDQSSHSLNWYCYNWISWFIESWYHPAAIEYEEQERVWEVVKCQQKADPESRSSIARVVNLCVQHTIICNI